MGCSLVPLFSFHVPHYVLWLRNDSRENRRVPFYSQYYYLCRLQIKLNEQVLFLTFYYVNYLIHQGKTTTTATPFIFAVFLSVWEKKQERKLNRFLIDKLALRITAAVDETVTIFWGTVQLTGVCFYESTCNHIRNRNPSPHFKNLIFQHSHNQVDTCA